MTLYALRDDSCVLHLPMNEGSGSIVYDHSRYGNNGQIVGANWTQGKFGWALSFDGVDDYVNIGNTSSLQLSNSWSVSVWFLVRSLPHNSGIIEKNWRYNTPKRFAMWISRNERFLAFDVSRSDNVRIDAHTSANLIEFGKWYHAVAVYDGANIYLYVNENLEATSSPGVIGKLDVGNLVVGYAAASEVIDGLIDEVRIYNRALSEEEIKSLYLYYQNFEVRPCILCPRPTI